MSNDDRIKQARESFVLNSAGLRKYSPAEGRGLEDKVKELESENKRLREALLYFTDIRNQRVPISEFSSSEALQDLFDHVIEYSEKALEK